MQALLKHIEQVTNSHVELFIDKVSNKYTIERKSLIDLWNRDGGDIKINTSVPRTVSAASKTASGASSASGPGCPYAFSRGAKAGTICGVKAKNGNLYCSAHKKYDTSAERVVSTASTVSSASLPIAANQRAIVVHRVYGYWHEPSRFVFKKNAEQKDINGNPVTPPPSIIGRVEDSKVRPFNDSDKEDCIKWGFTIPEAEKKEEKQISSIAKSIMDRRKVGEPKAKPETELNVEAATKSLGLEENPDEEEHVELDLEDD
jgi:hypothetical protein